MAHDARVGRIRQSHLFETNPSAAFRKITRRTMREEPSTNVASSSVMRVRCESYAITLLPRPEWLRLTLRHQFAEASLSPPDNFWLNPRSCQASCLSFGGESLRTAYASAKSILSHLAR